MDSKLLQEAIADAKAVRATALANAKVALEEAFAPRFEAMFANKLREDAQTEMPNATEVAPALEEENVSESEIDELIKELEDEVSDEEPAPDMGAAPDAAPDMDAAPDAAPDMDAAPDAAPAVGAPIPAGVPVIIQPVDQAGAGAAGAGTQMPPMPPTPPEGGVVDSPETDPMAGDDEEVNLDELLESLKEDDEDGDEKEEKCIKESVPVKSSAIAGKVGGSDNKKPSTDASATSHIESAGKDRVGGGEGYKSGPADPTQASRPNSKGDFQNTPKLAKESKETGVPGGSVTAQEPTEATRPNSDGEFENTPKLTAENASLRKQLAEATQTVVFIKGQLNEINLLNAKLLYTNKIFKEFSLNNEKKMRVVEMFDLSKSVREVKLQYASIAESLNFGGESSKKVKPSASVQSITEGIASKSVASTKPSKQIITEQSSMVAKFQKLAGIKHK